VPLGARQTELGADRRRSRYWIQYRRGGGWRSGEGMASHPGVRGFGISHL